jgi:hypothetical protein
MMNRKTIPSKLAGAIGVAILIAFCLGFPIPPHSANTADILKPEPNSGDVQTVPPNESFQTGDERSVPILKDILATLKQIDGRLERIESQMAKKPQ